MAMTVDDEKLPFFAIIGHDGKPMWGDTAIAYATFYHLIKKGHYVVDAVKAMREASGDDGFKEITAKTAKETFMRLTQRHKEVTEALKRNLLQENKNKPPSPEATNLEKSKPDY